MKRMLFNATHSEELRVAIVDGQKLIDIDIESAGRESRKSNIYKGVITRVEPSLEACFVNYGEERHGFLPFKEISKQYFKSGADSRSGIRDAISEGMEVLVQIDKEERGNKGAALTTFVSLAGRYLVLMPNNPRGGGVSRRVEGEDRQELRETMEKLEVPSGMSMIARTAGIGRNAEELQWDLNYLLQLWRAIDDASRSMSGAFLIYQESSLVIRAIRDYFTADIGEILIDTDDIYEQARQFMGHVMPDNVNRVKRYRDDTPLFSRFQIEHQIETAHSRLVPLPSGGAIVIDHTEALVSIDVNSARATRGSDIEETALKTNLEAADEVARQMRLRDLGGLIVIDFIDMESAKNQREVEQRLKDALHYDRARVQMGKISRFGLMELSRQRLRPALAEGSHVACPRCNGTGFIRDTESAALHVLRVIQEESMKENSAAVYVQVPVDVATYLLNEKRAEIAKMEARLKVDVVLIPNKHIETPHYKLERIKHDDERLSNYRPTYALADGPQQDEDAYLARKLEPVKPRQEAIVKGVTPSQPAPVPTPRPAAAEAPRRANGSAAATTATPATPAADSAAGRGPAAAPGTSSDGLFGRILGWFRRKAANEATASPEAAPAPAPQRAGTPAEGGERPAGQRGRGRGERGERAERGEERSREGRGRGEDSRRRGGADRAQPADARANGERAPLEARGADGRATEGRGSDGRSAEGRAQRGAEGQEPRAGRDGRRDRREAGEAASGRAPAGERQPVERQAGERQAGERQPGERAPRGERPPRGERAERGEGRQERAERQPAVEREPSDVAASQAAAASATGGVSAAAPVAPMDAAAAAGAQPAVTAPAQPAAEPTAQVGAAVERTDSVTEAVDLAEAAIVEAAGGEAPEAETEGNGEGRRRRRRRGGRRNRGEGREAGAGEGADEAGDGADEATDAIEAAPVTAAVLETSAQTPASAEAAPAAAEPVPVAWPRSPVLAAPAAAPAERAQATPTEATAVQETAASPVVTPAVTTVEATALSEAAVAARAEAAATAATAEATALPATVEATPASVEPVPASVEPVPVPAAGLPDTQASLPAAAATPAAAAAPAAGPAATPAVAAEPRTTVEAAAARLGGAPAARPATASLEPQSLRAVASSAGLEMVETRAAAPQAEAPAPAPAPRAPRVRRKRETVASEPLQQVETSRDDQA